MHLLRSIRVSRALLAPLALLAACSAKGGDPTGRAALGAATDEAPVRVTTSQFDNARTGWNPRETRLSPANVGAATFGKLHAWPIGGLSYGSPLYLGALALGAGAERTKNVVLFGNSNNTLSAMDADAMDAPPLWTRTLGPGVSSRTQGCAATELYGLTASAAVDPDAGALYAVEKTLDAAGAPSHLVRKIDVTNGADLASPVVVAASVPGTGDGAVNGVVAFDAAHYTSRTGVLVDRGVVYVAFGSPCDFRPYHGWVMAYDASTLALLGAWNATPDGYGGGVWQGGGGLATGGDGRVFVMTGNGTFDADTGGRDYGDAVVALALDAGGLHVVDWFAPHDQKHLEVTDFDLASGAPVLVPGTSLLVGQGKAGVLHVLDRAKLGGFSADADRQIVQEIPRAVSGPHPNYATPVAWNGPNGPEIFAWSSDDVLKAYPFLGPAFAAQPTARGTIPTTLHGAPLLVTSNGTAANTGIVWAADTSASRVRAFDAADVSRELWDSGQNAARDATGPLMRFRPPVVADGKLYVVSQTELLVYGLLAP